MRLRLVSLAAIMAVIAPAVPAVAAGSEGPATASAAALPVQAAPLQAAPVAELVSEVDIPWTRFTLDNGLTVIVHEDHKAPVVAVSVWYNVGSKDEPAGSTGFAHLFEHLMFGGSENAPGSYLGRMRNLGPSNLNGTTWFDRTNYFQTVPTPALEQALFLESDRMGYLLGEVGQEVLDLQRGVVQNEKRQGDNQPYGLFEYAQLEALFPEGHPYRHSTIGSMADLDAASLETVRNWFRENYGPNNAIVVLSGDITEATARPLMEKYFGAIPRGPVNTPAEADVPTLAAPIVEVMHDRVANTRLTRSWAVPGLLSDDAVPLAVGAQVLGGLASSRLDNLLVREEQTAVSVSSSLSDFHRIGIFDISVDVKPGQDAAEVSRRLDAVIADFIAQGPTAEEVARVATRYVSQRIQSLEQVNGKANVLAEGQLYAGDPDDYKKELAEYASVTPAQVTAAMQRWLTRPVFDMTIAPGEREAYVEAAATPSGATPVPAAEIQRVARDPMPAIGQVPDLEFPAVERATLSNGVNVVYARVDTVPVTRVAVEFDAGYAADPADRLGAQAMMLDLLDEGTTTRNANQLAEEEERLGASINVAASMDRTSADLSVVTANLTPSLTLLADVVRNPAFAASEIERIRASRLSGLASEKTNPNAIASRALPPLIYGETSPYGRSFTGTGDEATITALTRADLVATHSAWVRPDNATLFVVSDLPLSQVTPQLEAAFGDWRAPSTPRGTKTFADAAIPTPANRIVLIDRPQSPQSLIYGGAVLPLSGTDDLLALNAANVTLGSDFLSRINADLRETKGWSYGVRGSVNALEHRLPYIVNAPVQANRTGESITALIAQFDRFLETDGVQPNELERTINGNTRSLAGGFETSAQILGALRSNALFGRPDDYQATLASRTRALTAARMDEAARAVIQPDHFVWVVVGDAAVVRPQLDGLGLPVEVRSIE
ncbi:insulinase family protein [Brevundimonas sp. AJA228-03]|uniref:M16 family metallopeptidase n=1 Tax=Brevundimonas sp. AJA228-03 TaxID=2752515 RepID=UPI001AE0D924|nr:pitrilysin family protein [Brevundimonas sp. AJA228-03]QTN20062.1 insulinase family protein [Brevundimonas sp. AJA228-03]